METLKKLIRDSTTRDNYIGSPWIVKNAEEYGLSTELPDDLQAKSDKFHGREERERKKQRIANGEVVEGLPLSLSFPSSVSFASYSLLPPPPTPTHRLHCRGTAEAQNQVPN